MAEGAQLRREQKQWRKEHHADLIEALAAQSTRGTRSARAKGGNGKSEESGPVKSQEPWEFSIGTLLVLYVLGPISLLFFVYLYFNKGSLPF